MTKILAAIGILGVAGVLSICDLCTPGASRPLMSRVSVANASPGVAATARVSRSAAASAVESKSVTFQVEGMTCGGCAIAVRKVLTRLDGVTKADVTYNTHRAVVTYDPAKVTVEQMIAAIETLSYKATVVTV